LSMGPRNCYRGVKEVGKRSAVKREGSSGGNSLLAARERDSTIKTEKAGGAKVSKTWWKDSLG